jgi:asparagine synthetase B (glutamine-hydrolysing)
MCSIFGSYDVSEAKRLQVLNASRGALSHSSTVFTNSGEVKIMAQRIGNLVDFDDSIPGYHLYHQQAPTTQESNTIHPSKDGNSFLWHNGIVQSQCVEELKTLNKNNSGWDTKQINILINNHGYKALNKVRGSFSCVRYENGSLTLFRNEISPMYMNGSTISSVEFPGSFSTEPNIIYKFDFIVGVWYKYSSFENYESPFFFFD